MSPNGLRIRRRAAVAGLALIRVYRHIGMVGVAQEKFGQTRRSPKAVMTPLSRATTKYGRIFPATRGPRTRLARSGVEAGGTGPFFPSSLSLVAKIHPVSATPRSSI